MNIRPMNDRLLVKRVPEAVSIIVLTDTEPSLIGEVVAVGPGKRRKDGSRQPLDVKPGQLVAFGKFTDFDDGEHVLIQEADIRGIVSNA